MAGVHEENLYFAAVTALAREVEPRALSDALNCWVRDESLDIAAYLEKQGALPHSARMRLAHQAALLISQESNPDAPAATMLPAVPPKRKGGGAMTATVMGRVVFEDDPESQDGIVDEIAGRYKVIREYAKGGMGRILLVRDEYLGREIALKELRVSIGVDGTPFARDFQQSASTVARFLQEARITARLEHPAIVPVHELGCRDDGTLYYTMKIVRGQPLEQAIRDAGSLRARLALLPHFVQLCQAIAYAHSRGIIHRDIKPHNVIAGSFGETIVIDWGLAKDRMGPDIHTPSRGKAPRPEAREDSDSGSATREGDVLGTPAYMPPEQARGEWEAVDERSDIYALGAVLYELLTGKHPYEGEKGAHALKRVAAGPPDRVRALEPKAPPEIVAICERAMQRDPAMRYPNARDLADEVQRFQSGSRVEAYHYGAREQLYRFMRRHTRIGAVITVALLLLISVSFVGLLSVREREQQAQMARLAAEQSEARTAEALRDTETAHHSSQLAETAARRAKAESESSLYRAYISLADSHIRDGRYDQAFATLAAVSPAHRSWEWGRLLYLCHRDFRTYPTFRAGTMAEAAQTPSFTLNGATGVLTVQGSDGALLCFDALSRLPKTLFYSEGGNQVLAALHDPADRWLPILDDNKIRFIDARTGEEGVRIPVYIHWAWTASFSGGGQRIAVRQSPDSVALFAPPDAEPSRVLHTPAVTAAALNHDGAWLVTFTETDGGSPAEHVGELTLYETATGTRRLLASGVPAAHFGFAGGACYAAGGDGLVRRWDTTTGEALESLAAHAGGISAVAVSEDGDRMATAGGEGEVALWALDSAAGPLVRKRAFAGRVAVLAFDRAGTRLAAGLESGLVAVLDGTDLSALSQHPGHSHPVRRLQFHESAGLLVSGSNFAVKLWTVETPPRETVAVKGVRAAFMGDDGALTLVTASGEVARHAPGLGDHEYVGRIPEEEATRVILSPNHKVVLATGARGITLWCSTEQREVAFWEVEDGHPNLPAAFSPEGRHCAFLRTSSGRDFSIILADTETGETVHEINPLASGPGNAYYWAALAFTPGGLAALACQDSLILFDPVTGYRAGMHSLPHLARTTPNVLVFSPFDATFAVTVENHAIHLAAPHGKTTTLIGHTAPVRAMAFDPTGARLFSGSDDGTVKVWDTASGGELLNWPGLDGPVTVMVYDGSSHALLAGGENGLRVAHTFPWEDGAYPGTPALRLHDRVEAFKTYDARVAPTWADRQERLARAARAAQEIGRDTQAEPGGPVPAVFRAPWEAEGIQFTAFGQAPMHAGGARLANWHRFLELAGQLAHWAETGDRIAYRLAASELQAMTPASTHFALRIMLDWIEQDTLHHGVIEVGRHFMEQPPIGPYFSTYIARAALRAGEPGVAVEVLERYDDEPNSTWRVLMLEALLRRDTPGDLDSALAIGRPWLESLPQADEEHVLSLLRARLGEITPENRQWLRPLLDRVAQSWDILPWFYDLGAALSEAARLDRPIFLEIGSNSAPGTMQLRRHVYGNPAVQERIRDALVLCFLDADVHPEAVARYRVRQLPALFVLDHEGDILRDDIRYGEAHKFISSIMPLPPQGSPMEWRVMGPLLPEAGEETIGLLATGATPDFDASLPGTTGETEWKTYRLSAYNDRILLEPWLDLRQAARFLLYTQFSAPAGPVLMRAVHTGHARVWLNGELVLEHGSREGLNQGMQARCNVQDGVNTLAVVLDDVGPHVNFVVSFRDSRGDDLEGMANLPLPARPELKHAHLIDRARIRSDDTPIVAMPGVTRVRVSKSDVLVDWRANHLRYLTQVNPRPVMEDGQIAGFTGSDLGQIPLLLKFGLRDGDIITGVNQWHARSGILIQEAARELEGLRHYTIAIRRDGEPHTIFVDVDPE